MVGASMSRNTMLLLLIVMRTVTAGVDAETDDRPSEDKNEFPHILTGSSFLHDEAGFESGAADRIVPLLSMILTSHKEHSHEDTSVPPSFHALGALLDAAYSTQDALNRLRQVADGESETGTEGGRSSPTSDVSDVVENTNDVLMTSLLYAGSVLSNPKGHPFPDINDKTYPRFSNYLQALELNPNLQNKRRLGFTGRGQQGIEDKMHHKRPFDSLANNLIGKRGVFSVDAPYKKRPFDSLANNLIGKRGLFSVDTPNKKRPFDSLANNLIGKRGIFSTDTQYKKRPFDPLAGGLIG